MGAQLVGSELSSGGIVRLGVAVLVALTVLGGPLAAAIARRTPKVA